MSTPPPPENPQGSSAAMPPNAPSSYSPAPGQPPGQYYGPPSGPYAPGPVYAPPAYGAPPSAPLPGYAPPSMPLPGYGAPAPVSQFGAPTAAPIIAPTPAIRQGYLVAGIGALITLVAFFVFPYVGASYAITGSAVQYCGSACSGSYSVTAANATNNNEIVLLIPLLAVLIGAAAVFPATRNRAFGALTPRNGAIATLAAGGLGLLVLLDQWAQVNNDLQLLGLASSVTSAAGVQVSVGMGLGFWLMGLGFVAAIVGGAMAFRDAQAQTAAFAPPAMQVPGAPPSMPLSMPMQPPPPAPGAMPPATGMPVAPPSPPPPGTWPPPNPQP